MDISNKISKGKKSNIEDKKVIKYPIDELKKQVKRLRYTI